MFSNTQRATSRVTCHVLLVSHWLQNCKLGRDSRHVRIHTADTTQLGRINSQHVQFPYFDQICRQSSWAVANLIHTERRVKTSTRVALISAGRSCCPEIESSPAGEKMFAVLCLDRPNNSNTVVQLFWHQHYFPLFHGRSRTAYLYRCVWSGITGR